MCDVRRTILLLSEVMFFSILFLHETPEVRVPGLTFETSGPHPRPVAIASAYQLLVAYQVESLVALKCHGVSFSRSLNTSLAVWNTTKVCTFNNSYRATTFVQGENCELDNCLMVWGYHPYHGW